MALYERWSQDLPSVASDGSDDDKGHSGRVTFAESAMSNGISEPQTENDEKENAAHENASAQAIFGSAFQSVSSSVSQWVLTTFEDCCKRPDRISRAPAEIYRNLLPYVEVDSTLVERPPGDSFCCVGCVGCLKSLRAYEQRSIDFIPADFAKKSIERLIGFSCKSGISSNGNLSVDQIVLSRVRHATIFGIISALGSKGCEVADRAALVLLKELMRRMGLRQAWENNKYSKSGEGCQKDVEHQLGAAIAAVVDHIRDELPAGRQSGATFVAGVMMSFPEEIRVTLAVLGGIAGVRVIVAVRDHANSEKFSWRDVTPNHTTSDDEECSRIVSGGAIIHDAPSGDPSEYGAYSCPESGLMLRPTRALGMCDAMSCGLSSTPDFVDLTMPVERDGFVFATGLLLWQFMTPRDLVAFIAKRLITGVSAQEVVDELWEGIRCDYNMQVGLPMRSECFVLVPVGGGRFEAIL